MELTAANKPLSHTCRFKQQIGPVWVLLVFMGLGLVWLSTFRLGLVLWQFERIDSSADVLHILLSGLRVDVSSLCYLFVLPALLILPLFLWNKRIDLVRNVLLSYFCLALCFLVYLEVITPTFINEYDLRPNRLLIEYLVYPKEVFSMLWAGYKPQIFISTLALSIATWLAHYKFQKHWIATSNLTVRARVGVALILVFLLFLGARSSFGHRPLNPALVAFSNDHLLNDLAVNSSYSAIFALKQMGLENSSVHFYGDMPELEVIQQVRLASNKSISSFTSDAFPSRSYHTATHVGQPKNLVILLQESLGARYVGALGGLPLTPHLDKVMQQGWNFTNLYATGTRSVRGIEAIMTGFTPTPSRSVVKLDKSQRNFFTLASLLTQQGYYTQFIYGGESHFDNMKSFFLGNGVQDIVDIDDFAKVDFQGSWGASDEDLYDQAHREFEQLHRDDKPFFSLVFTSSNHSPYEYPDGKIIQYDKEKHTRNNAAKYADHALGQFLQKAQTADYWQDTIFLIVADHDSRVAGASLVPVERFRIPGVILGKDIKTQQDHRLVSQIDLAPTLLSLLGVNAYTPMLGHDLTRYVSPDKQRALMQYDKNFAYMTREQITILQPEKPAMAFSIAPKQEQQKRVSDPQWQQIPLTQSQLDKAKAHVLFGSLAYHQSWYQ